MLKQKGDVTISLQSFLLSCTWFPLICFHHLSFLNPFSSTTLDKDNFQNTVPPSINWHGCRRESKWVHIHEIVDGRVETKSHLSAPEETNSCNLIRQGLSTGSLLTGWEAPASSHPETRRMGILAPGFWAGNACGRGLSPTYPWSASAQSKSADLKWE